MKEWIINFKGMPLFQKVRMETPFHLQGELKDVACFFFLSKGTMRSYDGRGLYTTTSQNAILKNCGRYIQRFVGADDEKDCEATAVFLYPELLKEIFRDEVPYFLKSNKAVQPRKYLGNQLIEQYMNNLSIYFDEPEAFDEELGVLKLKELIHILLKSENSASLQELLSEVFSTTSIQLKEAVENNLTNDITIEQLAYICNMSLSTFKRAFKQTFNDTPARYIKNRRLEEAQRRILNSSERISDIAFDLGYIELSTFSTNFKIKFGASPSTYRKNNLNKLMDVLDN